MATFYNQATLSYNGNTTTSNITAGELVEVITVSKTALPDTYTTDDNVTYIVNIVNSGAIPFTNLTVSDNLGAFTATVGGASVSLYPLTYTADSIKYYVNGVQQTAPAVSEAPALTFTGISVPAGGNATLIYQASVNRFAPPAAGGTITNTATVSGNGISTPVQAEAVITAAQNARLTISKSLSPTTVTENGQLTYTFIIQNLGNTAAGAADNVTVTDTFAPALNNITVTLNGAQLTTPTDYSYSEQSGVFSTVAGQITVPAASYTQDTATGAWTVTPGVSVLTVTGTV